MPLIPRKDTDRTHATLDALAQLRMNGTRIPVWDNARLEHWFDALAALIAELPTEDMRIAWVVLIANDLCRRIPGLPIAMAAAPLWRRVQDVEKERI